MVLHAADMLKYMPILEKVGVLLYNMAAGIG